MKNNLISSISSARCFSTGDPLKQKDTSPEIDNDLGEQIKQAFKEENPDEKEEDPEDYESFMNDKKKTFYIFSVAAVSLIGIYMYMQINMLRESNKTVKKAQVMSSGKAQIGGPWELMDTKGNKFGSQNLKGQYYLVYFGFCQCPDICPQSLQKIAKALEILRERPEWKYVSPKFVFVSVDPDRDTGEKIEKFLSFFDPEMVGVTGKTNDDPALRGMMKTFKIYASKIELDEKVNTTGKRPYTLDHTIITYLMDANSEYLAHIGSNMGPSDIAELVVNKILEDQRDKMQGKISK